jgi:hypothetical protein
MFLSIEISFDLSCICFVFSRRNKKVCFACSHDIIPYQKTHFQDELSYKARKRCYHEIGNTFVNGAYFNMSSADCQAFFINRLTFHLHRIIVMQPSRQIL